MTRFTTTGCDAPTVRGAVEKTNRCRVALLAACSQSAGCAVAPRAMARVYQAMHACQMGDPVDPTCATHGVIGDRWDPFWSKARPDFYLAERC
jgi:hypothetical protein